MGSVVVVLNCSDGMMESDNPGGLRVGWKLRLLVTSVAAVRTLEVLNPGMGYKSETSLTMIRGEDYRTPENRGGGRLGRPEKKFGHEIGVVGRKVRIGTDLPRDAGSYPTVA